MSAFSWGFSVFICVNFPFLPRSWDSNLLCYVSGLPVLSSFLLCSLTCFRELWGLFPKYFFELHACVWILSDLGVFSSLLYGVFDFYWDHLFFIFPVVVWLLSVWPRLMGFDDGLGVCERVEGFGYLVAFFTGNFRFFLFFLYFVLDLLSLGFPGVSWWFGWFVFC